MNSASRWPTPHPADTDGRARITGSSGELAGHAFSPGRVLLAACLLASCSALPARGQEDDLPPRPAPPAADSSRAAGADQPAPPIELPPLEKPPALPKPTDLPGPGPDEAEATPPTPVPPAEAPRPLGSDREPLAPPAAPPPSEAPAATVDPKHIPQDLKDRLAEIDALLETINLASAGDQGRLDALLTTRARIRLELDRVVSELATAERKTTQRSGRQAHLAAEDQRLETLEEDLQSLVSDARREQSSRKLRMQEDQLRIQAELNRTDATRRAEEAARELAEAREELRRTLGSIDILIADQETIIQTEKSIAVVAEQAKQAATERRRIARQIVALQDRLLRPGLPEEEHARAEAELARLNQIEDSAARLERQNAALLAEQSTAVEMRKARVTSELTRQQGERSRIESKIQRLSERPAQLDADRQRMRQQLAQIDRLLQTSEQIALERERVFAERLVSTRQERELVAQERSLLAKEEDQGRAERERLSTRRTELKAELRSVETESNGFSAALATLQDQRSALLTEREELMRRIREAVIPMTLREAIFHALDNNVDIQVSRIEVAAALEGVEIADSVFDPLLVGSVTAGQDRRPAANILDNVGNAGLSVSSSESHPIISASVTKLFLTGAQVTAGLSSSRIRTNSGFQLLNPTYSTTLEVSMRQPLLKGFGVDYNSADLDIARLSADSARHTLHRQLLDSLWEVELAYWDLVFATEDLRVQQVALDRAEKLLFRERRRLEAGSGTKPEVSVARAGVAQRREAIINARAARHLARDKLVRLTFPSRENDRWDIEIVPTDGIPSEVMSDRVDTGEAVREALQRRPEIAIALLNLQSSGLSLDKAANDVYPELDFTTTWRQKGVGSNSDNSWDAIGSGRFYEWVFGLEIQLPLMLRGERAALRQAERNFEAARYRLAGAEYLIIEDVRRLAREIGTSRERIEATKVSLEASREQLRQIEAMVREGVATTLDVLELQEQLANAELSAIRARIDHHLAQLGLERAKALFLEHYRVDLR